KELESNVALHVRASEERAEELIVSGRGMLHLSILLENIRREGSELAVGKPRVITREVNGVTMEPIEYLVIDAPNRHTGTIMGLVLERQALCTKMEGGQDSTHIEFT